jgi:hypothetical protein
MREPLLSDLGISLLKETEDKDRVTEAGETVGARYFMAPEQERGGVTDVRENADIYALGKVLHFMLTSRHLFREELQDAFTVDEIARDGRLRVIAGEILGKVVRRVPEERVQSTEELLAVVRRLQSEFRQSKPDDPKADGPVASRQRESGDSEAALASRAAGELVDSYNEMVTLVRASDALGIELKFGQLRSGIVDDWEATYPTLKDKWSDSQKSAIRMIHRSGALVGAVGAVARTGRHASAREIIKSIEQILRLSEGKAGYVATATIPHPLAGFMYMCSACLALRFEKWDVLGALLGARVEWFYMSSTPLYEYACMLPYLFHPDSMARDGGVVHDAYRVEHRRVCRELFTLSDEDSMNSYVQGQCLISLKVAQLAESSGSLRTWPDFGRFYSQRVSPVFTRADQVPEYGDGLASAFGESRSEFLGALDRRLKTLRQYFSGAPYMWNSIEHWPM